MFLWGWVEKERRKIRIHGNALSARKKRYQRYSGNSWRKKTVHVFTNKREKIAPLSYPIYTRWRFTFLFLFPYISSLSNEKSSRTMDVDSSDGWPANSLLFGKKFIFLYFAIIILNFLQEFFFMIFSYVYPKYLTTLKNQTLNYSKTLKTLLESKISNFMSRVLSIRLKKWRFFVNRFSYLNVNFLNFTQILNLRKNQKFSKFKKVL